MTSRRSFITGLVAFVAAPAIVRAGSLMPVKGEPLITEYLPPVDPVKLNVLYGSLRLGDIITYEGVEAVSRVDGKPTGHLRQFVITSNTASEYTVYPPVVAKGRYRNVVSRPKVLVPNRRIEYHQYLEFPNSGDNALGLVPAST